MNLRCMYCQTMFTIGRDEMLYALQTMDAEKWTHYEAHCPKCRRANRVERKKLELANPNWQETLQAMAKEAAKQAAAAAKAEMPAAEKKAAPQKAASAASAKKPAGKSEAASKAGTTKKPTPKKAPSKAKGK